MREVHASYARVGEIELRLEPLPPTVSPVAEQPRDEAEDERRSLETLLHSSGVDPAPFLARLKRVG